MRIDVERNPKGQFIKQAVFPLSEEAKDRKYGHFKNNKYGNGNKGKKKSRAVVESSSQWKGDEISYFGIHGWILRNWGKAICCSNPECQGKSKNYDWASKNGNYHSRDKSEWLNLCRSCHRLYDYNRQK